MIDFERSPGVADENDDRVSDMEPGEWLEGLRAAGLPVVERRSVALTARRTELQTTVDDLVQASWSPETLASYEASWRQWTTWCDMHGISDPLNADEHDVALWVAAQVERGLRPAYITRQLAAVRHGFQLGGHSSPTAHPLVQRTVAGAKRRLGTASQQAIPLRLDDVRRILTGMAILNGRRSSDPQIIRDKALLALGWAIAQRAGTLVALNVDDLTFTDTNRDNTGGLLVRIKRSKNDPESHGHHVAVPWSSHEITCPVRLAMLQVRRAGSGAIFRSIDRHGHVGTRLSGDAVSTIIRRHIATALSIDPAGYSGHSLRAGYVTELTQRGIDQRAIMRQTGHRDARMMIVYDRPNDLLTSHPLRTEEWW